MLISLLGMKVPGNEGFWERTKVPGNETSLYKRSIIQLWHTINTLAAKVT